MHEVFPGHVTSPAGFLAAGVHAGIKRSREDLAIIASDRQAAAAAVFTTNRVKAAPVLYTRRALRGNRLQAVVANSGNANACTGPTGYRDARTMAGDTARALGLKATRVAVASTGVIGVPLPMDQVRPGIAAAVHALSVEGGPGAARAIMTTDTFPKTLAARFSAHGTEYIVGGMAKGSGMIHPQMATTLGFITTDACLDGTDLAGCLRQAIDVSFNMITVDGDTSTNDMVLVMANGAAGGPRLLPGTPELEAFGQALEAVCTGLAKQVVMDGEGATKFMEVKVGGAASVKDARKAARAVAGSSLVKTAVFGADGNWGRILCALGYSGARFRPERVNLAICGLKVVSGGCPVNYSESHLKELLSSREILVSVHLGAGEAEAISWGCDLTYEYVRINGSYRS
ncbi:MAG: bifunctional glutamate N-acetyltransferase/amino-acid acetyltransferase ArgJ [Bacillota bacterium]